MTVILERFYCVIPYYGQDIMRGRKPTEALISQVKRCGTVSCCSTLLEQLSAEKS